MLSHVTLPRTSLSVSQLCLGSNRFGTALDQTATNAILDRFVALGGNFIDTARSYGDWIPDAPAGASERAIGAWLAGKPASFRKTVVIATKGGFFDLRAGDYRKRVNPTDIASDLAQSLAHLGVASIDLYWLHSDDEEQPVETIIDALIVHQKAGRIRFFGASNWSPQRLAAARAYADSIGHEGFVACQPFWGLAVPNREHAAMSGYGFYYEDGLAELHAAGLAMVPYSGQSRGYFTKKVAGSVDPDLAAMYDNPANEHRLEALRAVAGRHGVSLNEAALAYLTSQPHTTIPIIGASRPSQLDDTVKALALTLSAQELAALAVS